ncbi:MAG: dUTP diphosphatase [Candidatus Paceibacterota bacterium]
MEIKIKKIDKDMPLPEYGHKGDAGFDLKASRDISLPPKEKIAVPTGLALEIPEGYVGLIWDKSGLAVKHGMKVMGGVIDSTYRGEILVGVINLSDEIYSFAKGDKVAQMIIQEYKEVIFKEEELSETERGEGGFGSTGKR